MTKKNRVALISVSNKENVVEFAGELTKRGWDIISTGGTAQAIKDGGFPVKKVSEITGFPEILGGRVKSLHPRIHGGILARRDLEDHHKDMLDNDIGYIDMVVVNLYPFVKTISKEGVTLDEAIENIDIGGPAMVRASAKNFRDVIVIVNPKNYESVLSELDKDGDVSFKTRCRLSVEAFSHTAEYDAFISSYLANSPEADSGLFPKQLILPYNKAQKLRYGENPQQKAAFYSEAGLAEGTIAAGKQLQGKELSFNNINDLNAAWELVKEFEEPCVVAVKHANPCGVGQADTVLDAYLKAYDADPVSIFGGIVAVNREVGADAARVMSKIFLEVIAAPSFSAEALKVFRSKPEVRLMTIPLLEEADYTWDYKKVSGGLLVQEIDSVPAGAEGAEVVTEREPTKDEWEALNFNIKVVKHVKSNAIVVGINGQTLGVGAGQMNRIGAAVIALNQAGYKAKGAVLASDAFFPFPDTVEEAAAAGITAIIQPGGSLKDKESVKACNKHNIAMVFTGRRYFKH